MLLARTFLKTDPSSVLEIVKSRHVQSKNQEVVILRDFCLLECTLPPHVQMVYLEFESV
jgi:hypothetical protein